MKQLNSWAKQKEIKSQTSQNVSIQTLKSVPARN